MSSSATHITGSTQSPAAGNVKKEKKKFTRVILENTTYRHPIAEERRLLNQQRSLPRRNRRHFLGRNDVTVNNSAHSINKYTRKEKVNTDSNKYTDKNKNHHKIIKSAKWVGVDDLNPWQG